MSIDPESVFKDIRFWLIVFFLVRLIGIGNPPLEVGHNWRQSTVTMVARNFLEVEADIFHPRVDLAGEKSGITGMEFPVLNYLIYLTDSILGYEHWHGRLVNLIISTFGCWFFFLSVRRYLDPEIAFKATLILLCSIWFAYSRKIMPDTFSVSLLLAAIYFGLDLLYGNRRLLLWNALLFVLLLALGALSKISSAAVIAVLILPVIDRTVSRSRKIILLLSGAVAIIPVYLWYWVWVPHLVDTYGFWHFFMGKEITVGFGELLDNVDRLLYRFYDNALKYIGFGLFVIGSILSIFDRRSPLRYVLLAVGVTFFLTMTKGGNTFIGHSYYIIPIVPVMALLAAYGIERIPWKKAGYVLLGLVMIEGVLNQLYDFRIYPEMAALERLESIMDDHSDREDLILINSGNNPTPLYFAHRRGWVLHNDELELHTIDSLRSLGLKEVVILKNTFEQETSIDLPVVYEDDDFRLYGLEE